MTAAGLRLVPPISPDPPFAWAPGIYQDISHRAYHLDALGDRPTLSRSCALTLCTETTKAAHREHPRLGGAGGKKATMAMDNGSVIHRLMLGAGPDICILDGYEDYKTKQAQLDKKMAIEMGAIPILRHAYNAALRVSQQLTQVLLEDFDIYMEEHQKEVTILWEEDGVRCRGRADLWNPQAVTIRDLKITEDANPGKFSRGEALRRGCDIQSWAYPLGIGTNIPAMLGRVRFEFVLCEVVDGEVRDVCVAEVPPDLEDLGRMRWDRAKGIWRECLKSGKWPGYGRRMLDGPPPYVLTAEEYASFS